MKEAFLEKLVRESKEEKETERRYELKSFVCLKRGKHSVEEIIQSTPRKDVSGPKQIYEKNFKITVHGRTFYLEDAGDVVIFYTTESSEQVKKLERFIEDNRLLITPWIEGYALREAVMDFVSKMGIISGYSAKFEPYRLFTGYAITMRIWGDKSDEILQRVRNEYDIAPFTIKGELRPEGEMAMKFRVTNQGKVSLVTGNAGIYLSFLSYFVGVVREAEKEYPVTQISEDVREGVRTLKLRERYVMEFLSSRKAGELSGSKREALLEMLTKGGKKYGFIGYRLGKNKANVLDLQERKMLYVTVFDDEMVVLSKNPTPSSESIKHLHREIVEHIHPYVQTRVEKIA